MKKIVSLFLILALTLGALCGCSGDTNSGTPDNGTPDNSTPDNGSSSDSSDGTSAGETTPDEKDPPTSKGLEFELSGNEDSYTVIGIGDCKDTTLRIPSTYKGLPVKSIGPSAFYDCDALTSVVIPNGVTHIEEHAFLGCTSLADITVPNSVIAIGQNAFLECDTLAFAKYDNAYYLGNGENPYFALIKVESEDIPSCIVHEKACVISGGAFAECESLLSVELPSGILSIGSRAFSECTRLASISIPNSVTSIRQDAFLLCDALAFAQYDNALYLGNSENPYFALVKLQSSEITTCTVHEEARVIAEGMLHFAELVSFTIGAGIESIEEGAFMSCHSLASISVAPDNPSYSSIDGNLYSKDGKTLVQYAPGKTATHFAVPEGVTTIGAYAFYECLNLTSVEIPNSVTKIGMLSFYHCMNLANIEIPKSVLIIGWATFCECFNLESISVASGNARYVSVDGNLYSRDGKTIIQYAPGKKDTRFTVPEGVTTIGDGAFLGCINLVDISLPNSLISIGFASFEGCAYLASITIPNGVTRIGEWAFSSCTSFTSVVIPDSVTSMDDYAFAWCMALTSVELSEGLTKIGYGMFDECMALTSVVIPKGITIIKSGAFNGCRSLADIYFGGDTAAWNDIEKEEQWDINTGSYTVYCTEGNVTK